MGAERRGPAEGNQGRLPGGGNMPVEHGGWGIFEDPKALFVFPANTNGARRWADPRVCCMGIAGLLKMSPHCRDGLSPFDIKDDDLRSGL